MDTLLVDQETVYSPRQSNDRLLLGLKGSLNARGKRALFGPFICCSCGSPKIGTNAGNGRRGGQRVLAPKQSGNSL